MGQENVRVTSATSFLVSADPLFRIGSLIVVEIVKISKDIFLFPEDLS